jgi:hypothetical protein
VRRSEAELHRLFATTEGFPPRTWNGGVVDTTTKWSTAAVAVGLFLPSVFVLGNALLGAVAAGTVVWAAITHDRDGSLSAPPVLLAGLIVCAGVLSDGYLIYALVGANVVLWLGRNGIPELRSS